MVRREETRGRPLDYYSLQRVEMQGFVPAECRRLLEVGCGEGRFGQAIRQRQVCEVWGVEVVPACVEAAASRLDRVLCGTFESLREKLPEAYFDCVVMNDVLEHIYDTEGTLCEAARLLAPGGVLVLSVPNVRCFSTLCELLIRKEWQYKDCGVLDRTHIRFFTEKSLRMSLDRLGFQVLQLAGINPIQGGSWRFRALYGIINLLTVGGIRDTRFEQFAVVARPGNTLRSP